MKYLAMAPLIIILVSVFIYLLVHSYQHGTLFKDILVCIGLAIVFSSVGLFHWGSGQK